MDFRIKNKKLEFRDNFLNNWREHPFTRNLTIKEKLDWVERYIDFCKGHPEYRNIKINFIR